MEEELKCMKYMKFSIICKEDGVETEMNGSLFGLAALITIIARRNHDVERIITFAAKGLAAANELDEAREDYANH